MCKTTIIVTDKSDNKHEIFNWESFWFIKYIESSPKYNKEDFIFLKEAFEKKYWNKAECERLSTILESMYIETAGWKRRIPLFKTGLKQAYAGILICNNCSLGLPDTSFHSHVNP